MKQHFTFIPNSNCYEKNGKLLSKLFWLIQWLQVCRFTKFTINVFSENNPKLSGQTTTPDEPIQR